MFYKIDISLIMLTQKLLDFFEINTSLQKEDIVYLSLQAIKWLIITTAVLSALLAFFVFPVVIFLVLISVGYLKNLNELKGLHRKTKRSEFLPVEIITRSVLRLAICGGFVFTLLITILTIHLFKSAESFILIILSAIIFSILCSEYLLCTTSLSLGEKQRRIEEKETRNMAPI